MSCARYYSIIETQTILKALIMVFTNIQDENQFNKALAMTKGMTPTFLYSCGSETNVPQGYITNQFIKNILISERPTRSKACGIFHSSYLEFSAPTKVLFSLPCIKENMPFGECLFIRYLFQALDSDSLMNVFKEDLIAYAVTRGYVPGVHFFDAHQKQILKSSYEIFMFKFFKGQLDTLRPNAEVEISFDSIDVVKGSVEEEIASLVLNNQRLELPSTKLKHYSRIKMLMQRAGGSYSKLGFNFPVTANLPSIMVSLVKGEEYNLKKKFQFFATSGDQSAELICDVELADGDRWLEPHAGRGAISNLARDISKDGVVIELMDENITSLLGQGYSPIHQDFLTVTPEQTGLFDKIIANPPFTKNADINHVSHMFHFLKNEGKLASIMSNSWRNSSYKIAEQFRNWLKHLDAKVVDIEAGEFKTSGTNIATCKIIFTKSTGAMNFDSFIESSLIAA
jgi:hypothetical protein